MICKDEALAALDRELDEVWKAAAERLTDDDLVQERAYQRGWIKGRDECWKSDDLATCIASNYEIRITELQVRSGLVEAPDYTSFQCDDGSSLTATFYGQTKIPVAVLTRNGEEQVLAYSEPSGSGARYEGQNVSYWEHQGEVSLTWMGDETRCSDPKT